MRIAVIGDGGWGTANAMLLSSYGHDVALWGAFSEHVAEMALSRRNDTYLPGVELPVGLRVTADRAEAVERADVVVLAPPSRFMA